ncbi:G-type lectin S-receptor-like serine/threonine-protein kinase At4g27290 isoform X2 [Durio zibethinus]|nr:G-type lectin S-receptor-like serine/threonine-protein kinase At4g27290 isoform X2 [Durio zibethinus]
MSSQGILLLSDNTNSIFWSSNTSRPPQNPVAQLLDSGNLVVRDGDENILWQSFDYPSDTLLPGMKLGKDFITGKETFLSSWKSADDPAQGEFSLRIDSRGFPQLVIMKGTNFQFRCGPWNGLRFTGTPELKKNNIYSFEFIFNEKEVYYSYKLYKSSVVSRLIVNQSGPLQRFVWIDRTQTWLLFLSMMMDNCDNYALCGAYGRCNIQGSPVCECLKGFVPKFPRDWSLLDWTDGCVRRTPLNCGSRDGFLKHSGVKLPDTSFSWFNGTISLDMCREMCLKNCSCTAYTNSDIRGEGSGCLLWFKDLMDVREFNEGGQELYVRMAASELDHIEKQRHKNEKRLRFIKILLIFIIGCLIIGLLLFIWKRKHQILVSTKREDRMDEDANDDMELPRYDFNTIAIATDNFSSNNKLGEGGFGPAYKGTLRDGQDIAVKRLSGNSGQGRKEFKNEVILIARLQHRNLVKLLGCCIHGDERMLIYEYMPNRSLDYFIFDRKRIKILDWHLRFHIICGIARGLLYLHQDSRLKIIHRDLKASNVLLDNEMNPKISDFGMAKTFGRDQSVANTKRVVGTYGYMPPEYAIDGLFSVKSDIFSFGVLLLEILSEKRNRGFHHSDHHLNLLGHAWRLWMDEKPLDLVDKFLLNYCVVSKVLRCIHVGLLCVQQLPEDRPNMASVVLMLGSDGSLPQPKQPGFYTERNPLGIESSSYSVNEITSTFLEAR